MSDAEKNELDMIGFLGADIEVEDMSFGSQYGLIQWVNGQPNGAKGTIQADGGFFLAADQGIEPPEGFTDFTMITTDGTEVVGFAKKDLSISPIRYRRCWMSEPSDGGLAKRFPWNDYEGADAYGQARGICHVVGTIEGGDEPFLFSFRGHAARAVMGMGRERGAIPMYGQKVIGAAKRLARKSGRRNANFPLCAFRLTLGPARDDKGKAEYTEVGSKTKSKITLPVWVDEPSGLVDQALLNRLYVGNELFADHQDIHREGDEWAAKWSAEVLNKAALEAAAAAGGAPVSAAGDGSVGAIGRAHV